MKITNEQMRDILEANFKDSDIYYNDVLAVLENDRDFFNTDYENEIELRETIEELIQDSSILDVEIIYYYNAMEYLKEHDNSLNESIEIAIEYGYTLENINSEVFASLLATRNTREEFSDIMVSVEADLEKLFN